MKQLKILAFGDSIRLPTGYGRVSQHVLGYFALRGHQVIQIGWGHSEPTEAVLVQGGNLQAQISLAPQFTGDQFGTQSVLQYIRSWKPDLVYNSNDFFTSTELVSKKGELPFFLVNYGIVDGADCAKCYKDTIKQVDIPVTPSKYGYNLIREITDRAMYIPHGVDLGIFQKSSVEKNELKKKYGLADKFVFGSVNRNIWRKQYPNLMRAFANLKNKHKLKDAVLYLIADPYDQQGNNFINWAHHLGLSISQDINNPADVMMHPNFSNILYCLSDQQLAEMYCMFDVMVTSSLSEGFGLSTLEAQACGTPVIACDHTANTELVEGHGYLYPTVKNKDGSEVFIPPTIRDITYGYTMPDFAAMEEQMLEAYNNRSQLTKYAQQSEMFARQYDWARVLPLWEQVLAHG